MNAEIREHYLYTLKELGDQRGGLIAITAEEDVPFPIKRVFYNFKTTNDAIRGSHANIHSSFVMISLSGSCRVDVDDGRKKTEYLLDNPQKALYIGKGLWKEMWDFTADSVLLILSDHVYDTNEYIRNYEEYLNYVG